MKTESNIATNFPYPSQYLDVLGSKIHYVEQGSGDPILFLHGMPTNSYIWRNIIPHLSTLGRCIAPDLIGMGKSDKPNIDYSIFDHIKYINGFIEKLNLKRITFVLHGWGSVVGFNYAMEHEKNCKGLAFYEAHLRPLNGTELSLPFQEQLTELQSQIDLSSNGINFIDKVIPQGMIRPLSETEMRHYREPFIKEGTVKPLFQYMQELSKKENKEKIDELIANYSQKLMKSQLPKLLLYSIPGFVTTIATVMWAKENLPNLEMVDIGEAMHYAQENNPILMGEAISIWLQGIEQTR